MTPGWTQALCPACFAAWTLGRGEAPHEPTSIFAQGDPCLICGEPTGIYVRIDPKLTGGLKHAIER